jgi:ferredoxin-NADP reductase
MITTSAQLIHKYDSPSEYVSRVFFQPQESFTFLEGQFMMIEATVRGNKVKKPYSIATTNLQLTEQKLI